MWLAGTSIVHWEEIRLVYNIQCLIIYFLVSFGCFIFISCSPGLMAVGSLGKIWSILTTIRPLTAYFITNAIYLYLLTCFHLNGLICWWFIKADACELRCIYHVYKYTWYIWCVNWKTRKRVLNKNLACTIFPILLKESHVCKFVWITISRINI